ncbi:MAG TPA: hypothetical protein VF139_02605 [Candidatus Polarisedimenticolaceae bacterium]
MRSALLALPCTIAVLAGCFSTPVRRAPEAGPPPPPEIRAPSPAEQPPPAPPAPADPTLPTLRDPEIAEFKAAFAGAIAYPRYVLALSPTCSDCVHGIAEFGKAIADRPDADLRVLVVWLPVLDSDLGPPEESARRPLRDPRVTEFWDPDRHVSPRMIDRAMRLVRAKGEEPDFDADVIAWDVAMYFPAGAAWEDPFPTPAWSDAPVELAVPRVKRALASKR